MLDLPAPFLDWANITTPTTRESRSLNPLLTGKSSLHRACVSAALDGWRLVYDGRHKLIKKFAEEDLLFDLHNDPNEAHNLITDPAYREIFKRLQTEI